MSIILSFDIGIKHLAWCLLDISANQIVDWNVHNLLEDEEEAASLICSKCKSKASYMTTLPYCKRHCPITPLTCKKDLPTLLALLKEKEPTKVKSKVKVIELLSKYYAMPIERKKKKHFTEAGGIHILHDAIRKLIQEKHDSFFKATSVLLENQPAYKNPTMKTVQIMLYTELRSAFIDNDFSPIIRFVHAGKKNKSGNAANGDTGYSDRKKESKARAEEWLKASASTWLAFYKSHKKRDDLADTFCMCID